MSALPVLIVRRTIRATPERLFEAWTDPEILSTWWGPEGVRCARAEMDARVGGRYRIDNELPDGRTIVITGELLELSRPERLVMTWHVSPGYGGAERVTVRFEPRGAERTEVIVVHEQIGDPAVRETHELGWVGCLDGLARWAQ